MCIFPILFSQKAKKRNTEYEAFLRILNNLGTMMCKGIIHKCLESKGGENIRLLKGYRQAGDSAVRTMK